MGSTYQDLVQEVLDKLLLERSRGEQSVEISSQKFGDKVAVVLSDGDDTAGGQTLHVFQRGDEDVAEGDDLCLVNALLFVWHEDTYILMAEMLE